MPAIFNERSKDLTRVLVLIIASIRSKEYDYTLTAESEPRIMTMSAGRNHSEKEFEQYKVERLVKQVTGDIQSMKLYYLRRLQEEGQTEFP